MTVVAMINAITIIDVITIGTIHTNVVIVISINSFTQRRFWPVSERWFVSTRSGIEGQNPHSWDWDCVSWLGMGTLRKLNVMSLCDIIIASRAPTRRRWPPHLRTSL